MFKVLRQLIMSIIIIGLNLTFTIVDFNIGSSEGPSNPFLCGIGFIAFTAFLLYYIWLPDNKESTTE